MNGLFDSIQELTATAIPRDFEALIPPPLLLPGERPEHYEALRQAVFTDIAPRSAIEWLLAIDVADACWEIRRYRILRHKLLESYRQKALETVLRHIDISGITPDFKEDAEFYTRQNALSWRSDPIAASEIEMRLASYGFDQHSISMEVYVQAREIFLMFDSLINGAQVRRTLLLKEIDNYRFRHGRAADRADHDVSKRIRDRSSVY